MMSSKGPYMSIKKYTLLACVLSTFVLMGYPPLSANMPGAVPPLPPVAGPSLMATAALIPAFAFGIGISLDHVADKLDNKNNPNWRDVTSEGSRICVGLSVVSLIPAFSAGLCSEEPKLALVPLATAGIMLLAMLSP